MMHIIDENYNIITDYDLKKGTLKPCTIINPTAVPIDNIKKFAWEDKDYIQAQMYVLYKSKPNPEPTVEQRLTDIELALADIYGGVI